MDFSSPHVGFVIAAYLITALVLFGLVARVIWRDRKLANKASSKDP